MTFWCRVNWNKAGFISVGVSGPIVKKLITSALFNCHSKQYFEEKKKTTWNRFSLNPHEWHWLFSSLRWHTCRTFIWTWSPWRTFSLLLIIFLNMNKPSRKLTINHKHNKYKPCIGHICFGLRATPLRKIGCSLILYLSKLKDISRMPSSS